MVTLFQLKCYTLLKKVPSGRVTTYKDLAKAMHLKPLASRAVGNAMALNPFAPEVPCHRVVKSNGKIGNYSAQGGIKAKIKLLELEGIKIEGNKIKEFEKVLFRF
jgi:O-6-methylguanine DNA methyltransferase